MLTENIKEELFDHLDYNYSMYGERRRFKTQKEIYECAIQYLKEHLSDEELLKNCRDVDAMVQEYINDNLIKVDADGNIESYLWERLYEQIRDKITSIVSSKYPIEIFGMHNLKMYKASHKCWNLDTTDKKKEEIREMCMQDWYDQFMYTLKDEFWEYFDFWKQVEQVGRTSSFYLWKWHEWYNRWFDDIVMEILEDILDDVIDGTEWASVQIVDENRIELYNHWYSWKPYTEILQMCADKILEDLEKDVDYRLKEQKIIYEELKYYKDNQERLFDERVADYAYYED